MMVSLIFAVKLAKYLRRMDNIKPPKNQADRVRAYSDEEEGLNTHGNSDHHSNQYERQEMTYVPDRPGICHGH